MTKIDIVNLKGEKIKDVKLAENIFGIEPNDIALKKAIKLQLDSARQGSQKAKTRSEVAGGGRKPFRQKGTGNARQGSIRAPHYVGGGVVFAPTPRSYAFKMNKKEKVLALKSALAYLAKNKSLIIVDSLEVKTLKTKDALNLMKNLKLEGKVLFISSGDANNLFMATRNLRNVTVNKATNLNVLDLTHSDYVVIDEATLKQIEEAYN
ncbi:MAG: 50S ribosomal protein L4 [Bacilli bacterium]|nr:50S ribosomal protein L4 [Bacilli bacterium]